MALLRGYADDLPLQEWLFQHIFPTEGNFIFAGDDELAKDFVTSGSELAVYEMLKTGTTLFNDMYFLGDITADVVARAGLRAVLGRTGLLYLGDDDQFTASVKRNTDWITDLAKQGKTRIYPSLIPHSVYMVPPEKLQEAKLAYEAACPGKTFLIHTHVHETEKEISDVLEKDWNAEKKSAVQVLDDLGMLCSRSVLAHCVHMTDEEIALLSSRGASVAHNPRSNLKLGSGIAPIAKMLDAGVNVCLGTDGTASNNTLDLLTEMQYASMLCKGSTQNPTAVTAIQALRMATINGAKALGLADETGSLTVGKAADMMAIDLGHLELFPIFDPLGAIVYGNRRDVSHVWVDGKCLVAGGNVLSFKPDMEKTQEVTTKIHEFRKTLPGREKPVGTIDVNMCR
jgi:5-methylthioadenosine/S-adenosylhomocysteine deaminase